MVECVSLPLVPVMVNVYACKGWMNLNPPLQPLSAVSVPSEASNSMASVIHRRRRLPGTKNNPTAARTGAASGHAELRAVCGVVVLVCTVRVEAPPSDPGVTLDGEKLPVAPAGSPLTVNATGFVNVPPTDVTVTENVVDPPGATDCDPGVALTVKSAGLIPLPERATVCGEPVALSANDSVAEKLAAEAGVNVT